MVHTHKFKPLCITQAYNCMYLYPDKVSLHYSYTFNKLINKAKNYMFDISHNVETQLLSLSFLFNYWHPQAGI